LRQFRLFKRNCVNQEKIRRRLQPFDCNQHCAFCGFEDIYTVNFIGLDLANGKCGGRVPELIGYLPSEWFSELF